MNFYKIATHLLYLELAQENKKIHAYYQKREKLINRICKNHFFYSSPYANLDYLHEGLETEQDSQWGQHHHRDQAQPFIGLKEVENDQAKPLGKVLPQV